MIDLGIIIRILTGFTGAFAFGIAFNVRGKYLFFASIGGFIATLAYELLLVTGLSDAFACFIVAMIITFYSEILARIIKTLTTTFIMTALVPLIPGSALYYTMSSGLAKNWELFFNYAYYACKIALSLAVGIIVITTLIQLVNAFLHFKLTKKTLN